MTEGECPFLIWNRRQTRKFRKPVATTRCPQKHSSPGAIRPTPAVPWADGKPVTQCSQFPSGTNASPSVWGSSRAFLGGPFFAPVVRHRAYLKWRELAGRAARPSPIGEPTDPPSHV